MKFKNHPVQRGLNLFLLICILIFQLNISNVYAAAADDFVITVQTDYPGISPSNAFIIPTEGTGYNYNVDCDNDGSNEANNVTGSYTCGYPAAGTYTIRIKDNTGSGTGFPRIYFNNGGDAQKLLSIDQWGTGIWTSMETRILTAVGL